MKLDEDAFLRQLLARLTMPPEVAVPPGDDCTAIAWGEGKLLLAAVDQVAADHHYVGRTHPNATPPKLIGRKLLARNLSDIAAMGGVARFALVAAAVERDCPAEWLDDLMRGVEELAAAHGVALVGGDLGGADAAVASLTILGEVEESRIMRRSGASPGDLLAVTGALGGSLPSGRHLTFEPRLAEGRWLAQRCRCAIDVSDGLLKDLGRVCAASGCRAVLDTAAIPRAGVPGGQATLQEALLDGEDYELIVALPASTADAIRTEWPFATPLTVIGRCLAQEPGASMIESSSGEDLAALLGQGYRHF